jgi:hypothetical protein
LRQGNSAACSMNMHPQVFTHSSGRSDRQSGFGGVRRLGLRLLLCCQWAREGD